MLEEAARTCLATLIDDLEAKAERDPQVTPFIMQLRQVDTKQAVRGPRPKLEHPAMGHLERAIENAPHRTPLDRTVIDAARSLDWLQLYGGGGMDPTLAEGMLAAQIAGSYGCFPDDDVATGLFLLAPGINYPLHTHAAAEMYYCMSGTLTLQHGVDGEKFDVSAGSFSITPPHRLHALWTSNEPVLLLYTWIGQISCPIWLWEQVDSHDNWNRSSWIRPPDKPWQVDHSEPVTPETMREAHGW